jgi:spoIIIJ-associated protein
MAPAAETPSQRAQELVERVVEALGLEATVEVREDAETLTAEVHGDSDDLGLLIGRHGQTIDALQHLAYRTAFRGDTERKRLVVDAAGYRERREATSRRTAKATSPTAGWWSRRSRPERFTFYTGAPLNA